MAQRRHNVNKENHCDLCVYHRDHCGEKSNKEAITNIKPKYQLNERRKNHHQKWNPNCS